LAIVFVSGGAWITIKLNRKDIDEVHVTIEKVQQDVLDIKAGRHLVRSAIDGLIQCVDDPNKRELLRIQFAVRNSPERPNYSQLREVVAERGRPPAYVLDAIRRIYHSERPDRVALWGLIGQHFTPEQIDRAAEVHGGSVGTFHALAAIFFADADRRGLDVCLRDAGLIDE
jgi:hypothetical protein